MNTLEKAVRKVYALSDALPAQTMRHDPKVHELQNAQMAVINEANKRSITEVEAYQMFTRDDEEPTGLPDRPDFVRHGFRIAQ